MNAQQEDARYWRYRRSGEALTALFEAEDIVADAYRRSLWRRLVGARS